MSMRIVFFLFLAPLVFAGESVPTTWAGFSASHNQEDIRNVSAINKAKWTSNCAELGKTARAHKRTRKWLALREYLFDNKTINRLDLGYLGTDAVVPGMTSCGTIAALGIPERAHRTRSATAISEQWVFKSSKSFVYIRDGLVEVVQD